MKTNTNKFDNPLQQWILEELSQQQEYVPLCYFKLSRADTGKHRPISEKCDFYNDEHYYCVPFYKPVSQFSAII
jgi:hypothetical protein